MKLHQIHNRFNKIVIVLRENVCATSKTIV